MSKVESMDDNLHVFRGEHESAWHQMIHSQADLDSIQARRARAYMWHMRWAMPTYDKMLESVEKAKGIDITKEDIDLLPWSCLWNRKEFQQEYERLQAVKFHNLNLQKEAEEAERLRQQEELRKQKERELAEERRREKDKAERQEAKRKAEERARKLEEERRRQEEADRRRQQEEADRKRKELEEAERKQREAEAARAKALADAEEVARKKAIADAEKAAREARQKEELEAKARAHAEESKMRAKEIADRNRRHKVLEYDLTRANEQREKSYMWFARMGQPNREKMKRLVRNLPPSNDDITEDDVDLLPWQMGGNHLSVKKMNELISKKQMTDDDLEEVFGRVRIEINIGDDG